jgi:hypothetical protein
MVTTKNDMNVNVCKYEDVVLSCCIPLQHPYVVSCGKCTTNVQEKTKKNEVKMYGKLVENRDKPNRSQ